MADIFEIAGRIHSTSQEGVATVATEVLDETQNKKQNTINADVARHENEIHGTGGIDSRLSDVEQLAEISIGGSDAQIATGADFTNPDATKRAKVPTVGAIVDGLNDGVYDVSKRNPTAGPNSDGKFTLDYILNNANTLIPTGWRHGGMTISFVQSSDNKYVQFRCMAQNFTTDVTQWAIADEGVYVENPEFIYVKTDAEGKILWAIKADGSIYFGAGVPPQVITYIQEKIAELSLNEYEDIVSFLNGLEIGDKTLQQLFDEKVDKEVGKSLSTNDYTNSDKEVNNISELIDNPEYLKEVIDNDGKLIEGILKSGEKVVFLPLYLFDKLKIQGHEISNNESPEYVSIKTDALNRIIEAIGKNGDKLLFSDLYIKGKKVITDAINATEAKQMIDDRIGEHGEVNIESINITGSYTIVGKNSAGGAHDYCVAVGYANMTSNTGRKCTVVGVENMQGNQGTGNTAVGYHSSFRNVTGSNNASFGAEALDDNLSGAHNTAIGGYCLQRNNLGSYNVAVGAYAMNGNSPDTPGHAGSGYDAGGHVVDVSKSIAVGYKALYNTTTGDHDNIAIGNETSSQLRGKNNTIAIGSNVEPTKSNQARIGNENVTEFVLGNKKLIFNQDGTVNWEVLQ